MEQAKDSVQVVYDAFPELTNNQRIQYALLQQLYNDWNAKINVISRADVNNLYTRHVLHSLAIARYLGPVPDGTSFVDLGSGGGFPGIPLAIYYPNCRFHLVDRIGKKLRVAADVADAVGLENVTLQHGDMSECRQVFDYVVSRAVMPLGDLIIACRRNIDRNAPRTLPLPPGLICLKGGDLEQEIMEARVNPYIDSISNMFPDPFFETKQVVYVDLFNRFQ